MSAAEIEEQAGACWVKTPYGDHTDLQEWWPAIMYRNAWEALSFINDSKICAQLFTDQCASGLNEGRVALLLGDIDETLQKHVIIADVDDESHVIPFFKGFAPIHPHSNVSASLQSALNQVAKRLTGAKEAVRIVTPGPPSSSFVSPSSTSRTEQKSDKTTKKNTRKAQKLLEPEEDVSYCYAPTECSEEHHPGEIGPNDSWKCVLKTLKTSKGWTEKKGRKNVDWYFIPPGGKKPSKNYSAIENGDYFVEEDKLKTYVMKTYGWKGDAFEPPVPKNFRLGTDFKETWRQLRVHGWKHNEINKTYFAPGKSSSSGSGSRRRGGGKEGVDFFKSKEDVVEFLKPFLKMVRSTKKRKTIKKVKSKPQKKISVTKTKRGRNASDHDENITDNDQTPQAKKIDSTEALGLGNSTSPTKKKICVEPRGNVDKVSPIATSIITKDTFRVNLSGDFDEEMPILSPAYDEQMPIGKKLNRCQILLKATYEMCSKNYYRKPNNVTSISGFLTGISQSIAIGQAPAAPKLLHILGPPGTGKTSAVRLCVRDLQKDSTLKKLNMVMWSAAAIRSSNDLFSKLCAQLGLNEYAGDAVIEKHLKAKNSLLVAVIDEFDLILHREARGLKEFFQWSYSPAFNFALILISNTYENQKLARLLPSGWDISSKQTVVFQAYDKNDLSNMLKLRINGPVFEDKALQHIATKTAAGGGDARRALSIASRSIAKYANMLSDEEKREPFSSIISKERAAISFKHVRMAIKELDKGGCLESIDGLPPVAKIALSVMSALSVAPNAKKRIITRGMLIRNCSLVASHNIVNMLADVGSHWVTDVLDHLSDAGLLEVSGDNSDCHSPSDEKLKLCINPIDVEHSLEEAFPQKGYYSRIRTVIFNAL